jgi:hypothetical protein
MIQCFGRNELGTQTRPCSFLLRPASPPESVRNCELLPGGSKQAQQALAAAAAEAASARESAVRQSTDVSTSVSMSPLTGSYELSNGGQSTTAHQNEEPLEPDVDASDDAHISSPLRSASKVTLQSSLEDVIEATVQHAHPFDLTTRRRKAEDPSPVDSSIGTEAAGKWPWRVNWAWAERAAVLRCEAGQSGGLRMHFRLELYELDVQRLQANLSAGIRPVFLLAALKPNAKYTANVYAINSKGRSASVSLSFHTFAAQVSNAKKQGKRLITMNELINTASKMHDENVRKREREREIETMFRRVKWCRTNANLLADKRVST